MATGFDRTSIPRIQRLDGVGGEHHSLYLGVVVEERDELLPGVVPHLKPPTATGQVFFAKDDVQKASWWMHMCATIASMNADQPGRRDRVIGNATPGTGEEPIQLGVLFVHGIGSQQRGDTLLSFGGSLATWMNQWVSGSVRAGTLSRNRTTLSNTRLRRDDGEPARSTLSIEIGRDEEDSVRSTWLMAESRWSDDFPTPGFREVATWFLCVAPWIIQRHLNLKLVGGMTLFEGVSRERRTVRYVQAAFVPAGRLNFARSLWIVVGPLLPYLVVILKRTMAWILAFAISVVAQLVIVGLVALMAIPFARQLSIRGQHLLSQSLGDSYALTSDPMIMDAMLSRIRDDVDWMAAQCSKVAVVGHSQGAALVHRALMQNAKTAAHVDLLVTFGAGIAKLDVLHGLHRARAVTGFVMRLGGVVSLAAGLIVAGDGTLLSATLIVIGIASIIVSSIVQPNTYSVDEPNLNLPGLGSGLRWVDLYASSDPVPEGRLTTTPPVGLSSRRVYNLMSPLRDHTSYWKNTEGFVHQVCRELAFEAGWLSFESLDSDDAANAHTAEAMRRTRLELLTCCRLLAVMCAVALCLLFGSDRLAMLGEKCLELIVRVTPVFQIPESISSYLTGEPWKLLVLGSLTVALVSGILYILVLVPQWHHWDSVAAKGFASRLRPRKRPPLGLRITVFVMPLIIVALGLLVVSTQPSSVTKGIGLLLALESGLMGAVFCFQRLGEAESDFGLVIIARNEPSVPVVVRLPTPRLDRNEPMGMALDRNEVWVTCGVGGIVYRYDFENNELATVKVVGRSNAIVLTGDTVWVTSDDSISKIDRTTNAITLSVRLEPGLAGLAVGCNAVWIASSSSCSVLRLDPTTGRVDAIIPVTSEPSGVVCSADKVWVCGPRMGCIVEIDPLLNEVKGEIDVRGVPVGRPAIVDQSIWMCNLEGGLIRYDMTTSAVSHEGRDRVDNGAVAGWDGRVWRVEKNARLMREVSADRDDVVTRFRGFPMEISVSDELMCVVTSLVSDNGA